MNTWLARFQPTRTGSSINQFTVTHTSYAYTHTHTQTYGRLTVLGEKHFIFGRRKLKRHSRGTQIERQLGTYTATMEMIGGWGESGLNIKRRAAGAGEE
jgi:hypothetical protein